MKCRRPSFAAVGKWVERLSISNEATTVHRLGRLVLRFSPASSRRGGRKQGYQVGVLTRISKHRSRIESAGLRVFD